MSVPAVGTGNNVLFGVKAISSTDISAITLWAKLLMMLEAAGSIALAVIVIGFAVNIL